MCEPEEGFIRRNPRAIMKKTCRRSRTPFIHSIQTTDERRVYTFAPTKTGKFEIVVTFPYEQDEETLQVFGDYIRPKSLTDAIEFVVYNESQFVQAFYESRDFSAERKANNEISEKAFALREDDEEQEKKFL